MSAAWVLDEWMLICRRTATIDGSSVRTAAKKGEGDFLSCITTIVTTASARGHKTSFRLEVESSVGEGQAGCGVVRE